jgi:hypothetical protein
MRSVGFVIFALSLAVLFYVVYVPSYSAAELEDAITIVMEKSCVAGPDGSLSNLHGVVTDWAMENNFALNGYDFGSTIKWNGTAREVCMLFDKGQSEPGEVAFIVKDSGEVIPDNDLAKLFGPVTSCQ